MIYVFFVLFMTLMGSLASLFLKKASSASGLKTLLFQKSLYIGGSLYVTAAVINIYVLRFLDYSVVLPLTSITYIWTMFLSHFVLKEKISLKKILGVILITVGAVFVAL